MRASCQEDQSVTAGLELPASPPDLLGKDSPQLETELINGQWFNQPCLCDEVTTKPLRTGFGELPGWWSRGDARRVMSLETVWKLPVVFFIWLLNSSSLILITWLPSKWNVSVLWAALANSLNLRRSCQNLKSVAGQTHLGFWLVSEVGVWRQVL